MQPEPHLPDENGDDENSSQDEEGEDPKGDQDGHLLQRVTAVWDRKLSRPRDATDPGTRRGPSSQVLGPAPTPVPNLTHDPQLYSLMGSGLGACEGSSARLSRLASVVVPSLAVAAGSGRAAGLGISHPKSWVALQGGVKKGALGVSQ